MQSAVRQVSTNTISIASLEERASYRLKLLRHLPATFRAGGAPLPGLTSSAWRTRSASGSKIGGSPGGRIFGGAETAAGEGNTSGWPPETQDCGVEQRPPQRA